MYVKIDTIIRKHNTIWLCERHGLYFLKTNQKRWYTSGPVFSCKRDAILSFLNKIFN